MKKLILLFAAAAAAVIYIFNAISGSNINISSIKKLDGIPMQITTVQKEGLGPHRYIKAFVTEVVDGDTLEVTYKGETHKVRLLYIDTPESVKKGTPVQPYAKEASNFTKEFTLNKSVKLVFEKGLRDKYGRLLAHVMLKNGDYLNGLLVRNGFARVEVVSPNKALQDYFYELQKRAINEKLGVWELPEGKQPFVEDENGVYIPKYWLKQKAS